MQFRSHRLVFLGIAALTVFMTACGKRGQLQFSGINRNPGTGSSATCNGPIQGSLTRILPAGTIQVGANVTWKVDVHQFDNSGSPCRGDYFLQRSGQGSVEFDGLENYVTQYNTVASAQVESVTVFSATNSSLSITLNSAAFAVEAGGGQVSSGGITLSCSLAAIPNSKTDIPTRANGTFVTPESIVLDVVDQSSPSQNLEIVRVTEYYFENGIQRSAVIPAPSGSASFHRIPVSVTRPFEHSYLVEVRSASAPGQVVSCGVATHYSPAVPSCTISAAPRGSNYEFTIGVNGYHTSIFFDGMNVTSAPVVQVPGLQAPGTHQATVYVAGVGQRTCSTVVDPIAAPTCALTSSANSVQRGTNFNLTTQALTGTVSSFSLSGSGVATTNAATSVVNTANLSPGNYSYTATVRNIYNQSNTCSKTVQVTSPPPAPTCTISVIDAPNPLRVNDYFTLRINKQNAVGSTLSGPNLSVTTEAQANVRASSTAGNYTYQGIVFSASGVQGSCSKVVNVSPPPGQWYSLSSPRHCSDFCSSIGKQSKTSPEGHACASGELIPASSVGVVNYKNGCWRTCAPHGAPDGRSYGKRCYGTNQKHDPDKTDLTVGCYCG